jgi:hypothetical protein
MSKQELLPCPFCGAGETKIEPHYYWTGMRNAVNSVSVIHWCPKIEGVFHTMIERRAKTEELAVTAWNYRPAATGLDAEVSGF